MPKTPRIPRPPTPSPSPELAPSPDTNTARRVKRARQPQPEATSDPATTPAPEAVAPKAPRQAKAKAAPARPAAKATRASAEKPTTARAPRPASRAPKKAAAARAASAPLRVLVVASEAVPYSKTGGLADVAAALPRALAALGHEVTLVVPRHRGAAVPDVPLDRFTVEMGGHDYDAVAYEGVGVPGLQVVLIDHPAFFDRDGVYGSGNRDYEDNPRRFAFLSLAAFEFARRRGTSVDVVHAHDWPTGLVPVYLRTRYDGDAVLGNAATVFTIHNAAYQGLFSADWLPQLGLGWDLFTTAGLEYWLHVSLLKGGITFSDVVTTVSRRYAQELQAPETSFGFDGVIRSRADDLLGIQNGIDVDFWNPATDPHLPVPYDASNMEGKAAARRRLLETLQLTDDSSSPRPIIAMVSRMVDQKGLDLIAAVADDLPSLGATFVVMGEGEPWYEEMWRSLARRYPDRIAVRVGFDEGLSHLIEAGSDIFMMPSHHEPCGLNQMYSLRYGTVPVVRATGGLADTVDDADRTPGGGDGFVFEEATGAALLTGLRRALKVYREDPARWRALQQTGMARDFSWNVSARAYLEAYGQALEQAARRRAVSLAL